MQSWSDSSVCLGLDMGATSMRASVVGPGGRIVESTRCSLPEGRAARVQLPIDIARGYLDRIDAVGLAVAGTVTAGRLTWTANLGIADIDYAAEFRSQLGLPAVVLNDARAAGIAEAATGAGVGARTLLALTIGTGIGGALLVDGKLVEGTGQAGEVGHLVIDRSGLECGCGKCGCWETVVGGRALARVAASLYPLAEQPMDALLEAAAEGEPAAVETIDRVQDCFRDGVDNLAAILAPDVIVLGGGMMARNNLLSQAYLNLEGLRWFEGHVARSTLGDLAGQLGAAFAAHALLHEPA